MTYREWIENEAIIANSDRCTFSLDWNVWCCYRHDLACLYGKDPLDAFCLWKNGETDYWLKAKEQSRREADKQFWKCNREMVKKENGGWWKKAISLLRTDIRYVGVRIGAIT